MRPVLVENGMVRRNVTGLVTEWEQIHEMSTSKDKKNVK